MRYLLSGLAGGLTVFGFAPFNQAWLVFIALAVLLFLLRGASTRTGFVIGLAFGTGLFLGGASWVYNSLAVYGGMPLWMGSIAVLGFALLLGTFYAVFGASFAWLQQRHHHTLWFVAPFAWVVMEWSKSWVLTGFPWLDLGYSQVDGVFAPLAPVGGVYLVSFAIAMTAALLVKLVLALKEARWARLGGSLILLGVVIGFSLVVRPIEWGSAVGAPVNVGVVQPNADIVAKWNPQYRSDLIGHLTNTSATLAKNNVVDLLVWPETALPLLLSQVDVAFWNEVRPAGTTLIAGLIDQAPTVSEGQFYNAAAVVCAAEQTVYRKQHLVPFGEYLPMRWLFQWVLNYLNLPMSDLTPGGPTQAVNCGGEIPIGLTICYEDAYAELNRQNSLGAHILVNISEDAWFGDSIAPDQRLQMARMRALEVALPLVRSGNSGPSAMIDHRGRILAESGKFQTATLLQKIQPRTGQTVYQKTGAWIIWLALSVLVWQLLRWLWRRTQS